MAAIEVLYADDHLVVVDKPAGLLVVPAPGRSGATLIDRLAAELGGRFHAVHRLDEGTTGALVVARSEAACAAMEDLFRRHDVVRDYLALVAGIPTPPSGRIRSQLQEQDGVVQVVTRGGRTAVTTYETLGRRGRFTLVRCRLETGRRNQIRVHMSEIGCPLAGDRKYGFRARPGETFRWPLLHSWRIAFQHPILEVRVEVQAPPPDPLLVP
jgi:RluA family pseudouridine synthase